MLDQGPTYPEVATYDSMARLSAVEVFAATEAYGQWVI